MRFACGEPKRSGRVPGVTGEPAKPSDAETLASARTEAVGAVAVIGIAAALVFGPGVVARLGPHPPLSECERLLARYIELREQSVTNPVDPKRYEEALREAKELAGPKFSECTTQVTLEEAECAWAANNVDEMERCLR